MASFYGKHWIDLWADVPMDSVKAEWQAKLNGMPSKVVFKAVDYCSEHLKFPPSLPEFFQLCKANTPSEIHKALPRHFTDEELERNQKRIQEAAAEMAKKPKRDMKQWARDIQRDVANGIRYPDISVRFANEALAGE